MADREFLPSTIPAANSGPDVVDTALPDLAALSAQPLEVLNLIGKGGMGEVWTCRDASMGRELAMKTSTATDAASQARFVREARVQGQLEHPGIVPVHELGLREGRPFFTMKRVRGVTLAEILRRLKEGDAATRARFPRHRLLAVVQTLAQTLDFAHSRGVVHRDVKPGNVMLGDFGEVYLLDWGLAKVGVGEGASTSFSEVATEPNATLAGAVMGTPGYMAPEQAAGEPATAVSDVWALGSVLYEALTLEPLVQGRSSLEVLAATHGPFPLLRDRKATGDVAVELESLCSRAVSKHARERPTARQLADGLDLVLSGQRDLELRDGLATRHAVLAEAAAQRAFKEGSLEARREALREVGRALALSPDHPLARATFLALLETPPRVDPPEVSAQVDQLQLTLTTEGTNMGVIGYLSIAPFLLIALWMGVRDAFTLGAMSVAWFALVCASLWAARNRATTHPMRMAVTLSAIALGVGQSWVLGPFMIIPGLVSANAIGLMMWVHKRERVLGLLLSPLAMIIPLALQLAGVVTFYTFEHGTLVVQPHALELPMVPTLVMLTLAGLGTSLVPSFSMLKLRETLDETQRQLALQRWTFEQLGGRRG